MYHDGMRRLQDARETRPLADRLDDRTLAIPDYDGNGMYRTWGNVLVNPHVGLLFLDFEQPRRIRVNGTAQVGEDNKVPPKKLTP
ncbi:MAG: pyridoxamine 5'-phosphate oxidase family protein [Betaproteobacteria bacterium]|nr:pyridoxamine 5'-phosphate oxidase family protein [Betaproteobacteria bacterium]